MVKGFRRTARLLTQRVGRNWKEYDRTDDCREVAGRGTTRCLLLLFARLQRPEQPPLHLPHPGCPTRAEVCRISIDLHSACPVGSRSHLRVTAQPAEQVDFLVPQEIRCFHRNGHRCLGQMQGRGTSFRDPVGPRTICIRAELPNIKSGRPEQDQECLRVRCVNTPSLGVRS